MNAHTQITAYTERQLDAFALAKTWQLEPIARAELSKIDAAIAAYKATRADAEWNALCDAQADIVDSMEAIREEYLADLCSDNDHYDDLSDDAIGGEEAIWNYTDGVIFGEAELWVAA